MPKSKSKPNSSHEIIFVGRSNVGKSTLIRSLTGKSVPVGRRPGVTLKPLHLQFNDLLITDMPGFGFMSGVKERKQDIVKTKFVRYIEQNKDNIIIVILVLDAKSFAQVVDRWEGRGEIPVDVEMFQFLRELDIDVIAAVNKVDKIKDIDNVMDGVAVRLGLLPPWRQWLDILAPVSAKKGDIKAVTVLIRNRIHDLGRDDLLKWIK
ncbi:MAG: GTP-binding protein EngB [Candidatus Methanomarinus sp.]|uniref:GTP-binding protein EngB n=1 Tax=Candidatus Methanomarinus sp. TaxID=3386244 RepID=A0AC61S956_9EURY|nr:MAG: GTP-binding protein EngB [ANME-2 cluster archaeon]